MLTSMLTFGRYSWRRILIVHLVHFRYGFLESSSSLSPSFRIQDWGFPAPSGISGRPRVCMGLVILPPKCSTGPPRQGSWEWLSVIGVLNQFAYARLPWASTANRSVKFSIIFNSLSLSHFRIVPHPAPLAVTPLTIGALILRKSMGLTVRGTREDKPMSFQQSSGSLGCLYFVRYTRQGVLPSS